MKNQAIADSLNSILADSLVLAQKLHHYHWRVQGAGFYQLHGMFEQFYDRFNDFSDEIAERMLMSGAVPLASLKQALAASDIAEDESVPAARDMVLAVKSDFEGMHRKIRAAAVVAENEGDRGSIGVLDGAADALEKDMWMMKAWLQK
jgi:starvation-inducible DNA-binding protein